MTIDPCNEVSHLPFSQIYLESGMHALLQSEEIFKHSQMVIDVKCRCRQFIISMCVQVKKRIEVNYKLRWMCSFLSPRKVLDPSSRVAMPSMFDFVHAVPRIYKGDRRVLDNEWRNLGSMPIPQRLKECDIGKVKLYKKLKNVQDNAGVQIFNNFATFALQVLSLPTSNADAERLFLKLSLIKTKSRNSLQLTSINALNSVSEAVKEQGGCMNFNPSKEMVIVNEVLMGNISCLV